MYKSNFLVILTIALCSTSNVLGQKQISAFTKGKYSAFFMFEIKTLVFGIRMVG